VDLRAPGDLRAARIEDHEHALALAEGVEGDGEPPLVIRDRRVRAEEQEATGAGEVRPRDEEGVAEHRLGRDVAVGGLEPDDVVVTPRLQALEEARRGEEGEGARKVAGAEVEPDRVGSTGLEGGADPRCRRLPRRGSAAHERPAQARWMAEDSRGRAAIGAEVPARYRVVGVAFERAIRLDHDPAGAQALPAGRPQWLRPARHVTKAGRRRSRSRSRPRPPPRGLAGCGA
jgi:hypothetical protein